MTVFMPMVNRSQSTHSSSPAELWFCATETKRYSSVQIKSPFFLHSTCQWESHGEVCPDLIGVEFAARAWRSDSRQKTIGSTAALSLKLILPTHHMYSFALRWAGWANLISNSHSISAKAKHMLTVLTQEEYMEQLQHSPLRHWGTFVADFTPHMHFGPIVWSLAFQQPFPNKHTASLTPLLAPFSLSSPLSGWIRSSSACCCVLLSERTIHRCLSPPLNQKGLQPHLLLPFSNVLSMQTLSK